MKQQLCVAALVAAIAGSPAAAAPPAPSVPYLDWGACPFECCTYGSWTAVHATVVLTERRVGAPIAFRVRPGESVKTTTGVVVTKRPGRIEVLSDLTLGQGLESVALRRGDVVYVLHYLGEGYDLLWFKGKTFSDQIHTETLGVIEYNGVEALRLLAQPQVEWWVKVTSKSGRVGWSKHPEHFSGSDACG